MRLDLHGLSYPSQDCGKSYEDFRSGWTFKEAYEHVAYQQRDTPRTITRNVVARELGKLKRSEYERYLADCEGQAIYEQAEAVRPEAPPLVQRPPPLRTYHASAPPQSVPATHAQVVYLSKLARKAERRGLRGRLLELAKGARDLDSKQASAVIRAMRQASR